MRPTYSSTFIFFVFHLSFSFLYCYESYDIIETAPVYSKEPTYACREEKISWHEFYKRRQSFLEILQEYNNIIKNIVRHMAHIKQEVMYLLINWRTYIFPTLYLA